MWCWFEDLWERFRCVSSNKGSQIDVCFKLEKVKKGRYIDWDQSDVNEQSSFGLHDRIADCTRRFQILNLNC